MTDFTDQVKLKGAISSLTIQQEYNGLLVSAGGSGYTSAPSVTIDAPTGGGTQATATASIEGPITGIPITNGGSGYTSAPTVNFSGGGGSGAQATAIVHGGQVIAIDIADGGTNYTSPPSVSFSGGGGSGATAQATMSVQRLNVTNPGSGYTLGTDPNIAIGAPTGPAVACNTATAYAKVKYDGTVDVLLGTFPKGASYLTLQERRYQDEEWIDGTSVDVLLINSHDGDPLLTVNKGAIIEKDLAVGGFIDSIQGALWLNYGLKGKPILSTPPCIQMMASDLPYYPSGSTLPSNPEKGQLFNHNGTKKMWNGSEWITRNFTGNYDTLFLLKFDGISPAHLDLGNLTVQGVLNFYDNNVRLYRDTNNLRVQTPSAGGLTVEQNLWCKALAVDTNAGIVGTLTFGSSADTNLYRSAANTLKTDDILEVAGVLYGTSLSLPNGALVIGGDTNLYRAGQDVLKTDDNFIVGNNYLNINPSSGNPVLNVQMGGSTKGFFGSDGNNTYIASNVGELQLTSAAYKVRVGESMFCWGYSSPVGQRILIPGDGTGWHTRFARGTYGSPVDVCAIVDQGDFIIYGHNFNMNPASGVASLSLQNNGSTKAYFTWDGSNTYLSGNGTLTIDPQTNIVLYPVGGAVYVWGGKHIIPQSYESGMVGNSNYPFYASYTRTVYAKYSGTYDAYDDLELVKQWGKTPLDSRFSIFASEQNTEYYDLFKLASFNMGCSKALALKQDTQDTQISALLSRVEAIENQLKTSQTQA